MGVQSRAVVLSAVVVTIAGWAPGTAGAQALPGLQDVLSTVTVAPASSTPSSTGGQSTLPAFSAFGTLVSAGAGPRLLSLLTPVRALVGRAVTFSLSAADDSAPLRGLNIDFGEPQGRFGETACRRDDGSRQATFAVPYTFHRVGLHTISLELSSGTCSSPARATVATFPLVVLPSGQRTTPRAAPRSPTPRAATPDSALAAAKCRGANRIPRARRLKAARVATLCLLNVARRAAGRSILHSDTALRRIATAHSSDMVRRHYFDHTEPPDRTLLSRLRTIHWSTDAGENLGYSNGPVTPRMIMAAWLHSSEHRKNILDKDYRYVGIGIRIGDPLAPGVQGTTYTTDFGGQRPRSRSGGR